MPSAVDAQPLDSGSENRLLLSRRSLTRYIPLLYFFSGVVGLSYQVLWAHMLSMQFGVSIFGVVFTAAAFMLGLGGGSLLGARWSRKLLHPLRCFALIEGVVALYALSLPWFLKIADSGTAGLFLSVDITYWYALQGVVVLTLITLPAAAMGVAFPMVLRAAENTPLSLSKIYGLNTCGGALGALLPLWLLPQFGWSAALWIVAFLGVVVAGGALGLARRAALSLPQSRREVNRPVPLSSLFFYAGVGAAALILEVGWTRLFGMILLRTEYVMAVILAVFLIGIGGGSLLARYMRASFWYELLPFSAAIFALFSLWGVPWLAAWAEVTQFNSLATAMVGQGVALALLILPVTLLLGAWLPLLSSRLGTGTGAWLYGANSVGAALGALAAGFILIPLFGTAMTIVIAALLLFVCGMVWAKERRLWALLILLLFAAWPLRELPEVSVLLPNSQVGSSELSVHEDALAITHVVERRDGQRLLLADLQRMDASSEPAAVVSQQNQVRLPLLLHPQPESVLFLGLGTGISAAGSLPFPALQRTAVELSQGAIDAAGEWFLPVNDDITEGIRLVRDDARRFLRASDELYDVIIGDLFHPDLVGRSALLSLQQFQRAKQRLTAGGIFVQWLALNQFDPDSLIVILRTFQRVFPDAVLFVDGFRLALVGSDRALSAAATLANLARLESSAQIEATGGEGAWSWLGRYWGPLQVEPVGAVQDEWAPVIEYQLPRAHYRGEMDLVVLMEWLLQQRPHVDQAAQRLAVDTRHYEMFKRGYVATEFSMRSWIMELRGDSDKANQLLQLAYQANPKDQWVSSALADRMFASLSQYSAQIFAQGMSERDALTAILSIRPDHVEALRSLWRLEQQAGTPKAAEYRQRLQLISPLDSELKRHDESSG